MKKFTNKIIGLGKNFENKLAGKKPVYYAVFLNEKSRSELLKWFTDTTGKSILDQPFGHHMTVKFKPTDDDVLKFTPLIGQECKLQVIGYGEDDKGQAVLVSSDVDSANTNPHITVSCAAGVKPVYSNELLSSNLLKVNGPILTGTFDSFPRTT